MTMNCHDRRRAVENLFSYRTHKEIRKADTHKYSFTAEIALKTHRARCERKVLQARDRLIDAQSELDRADEMIEKAVSE